MMPRTRDFRVTSERVPAAALEELSKAAATLSDKELQSRYPEGKSRDQFYDSFRLSGG